MNKPIIPITDEHPNQVTRLVQLNIYAHRVFPNSIPSPSPPSGLSHSSMHDFRGERGGLGTRGGSIGANQHANPSIATCGQGGVGSEGGVGA